VPARLSPTERIRAQLDELFAGGQPLAETLEEPPASACVW
jgi:hypothetical protein